MEYFSFLLCLICIIWLIFVQQKLDNIYSILKGNLKESFDINKTQDVQQICASEQVANDVEPLAQNDVPVQEIKVHNNTPETLKHSEVEPYDASFENKVKESLEGQKKSSSFQEIFLGNIFNKIGALALIIAVIIFIKLISPFIIITPLMKVILGFLFGGGLVYGGLRLHQRKDLKNYSEVLLGTGFATLFITTFCAYSMFNIFNTVTVILLGICLLVSTFELAHKMQTPSMIAIGLLGGYLTPTFSGASYEVCMWFFIFLNLVSLIYTLRSQKFHFINVINLIITMFVFLPYVFDSTNPLLQLTLWLIYIVYDMIRDKSNSTDNALSIINYVVLAIFSMFLFKNSHVYFGYLLCGTAIVYAGFAYYSKKYNDSLFKTYIHFCLLNLWLGTCFLFDAFYNVFIWSVIAFALSYMISKYKFKFLSNLMHWYFATCVIATLFAKFGSEYCLFANYAPILNLRVLVFAIPVILMLFAERLLKQNDNGNENHALLFTAISMGYIGIIGEITSLLTQYNPNLISEYRVLVYSIIGFIYSLHMFKLKQAVNISWFDQISILVFMMSLFALLMNSYNYHTLQGYLPVLNIRFLAYVTAIGVCLYFSKIKDSVVYKYIAVIFGFILTHLESVGLAHLYSNLNCLVSVSWVVYSGLITLFGIIQNKRYLINSGIAIIILSIFRIFIFDLAKVDAIYKLLAFLALGIILMYVSYVYTANKKNLK